MKLELEGIQKKELRRNHETRVVRNTKIRVKKKP